MDAGTLIDLVRVGWLTLTFAMLLSRFLFQTAGPVRMRAFLDQWQEGRAKRWWGVVALAYAAVVVIGALTVDGDLSGLEWALLVVLVGVLLADGLVNVLPAGFRTFKDSVQEAWVKRRGERGGGGGDDRLFLAGNVALGLAAAGMAALVIAYAPIALSTVALALALSLVMIGGLVGRRLYA
jgi:hypothetical protein